MSERSDTSHSQLASTGCSADRKYPQRTAKGICCADKHFACESPSVYVSPIHALQTKPSCRGDSLGVRFRVRATDSSQIWCFWVLVSITELVIFSFFRHFFFFSFPVIHFFTSNFSFVFLAVSFRIVFFLSSSFCDLVLVTCDL